MSFDNGVDAEHRLAFIADGGYLAMILVKSGQERYLTTCLSKMCQ